MASIKKRPDGRWRARYRDETGHEHAKHFIRKVDAQAWLNEVTAAVVTGQYADPRAGRITFETFYAGWSKRQVWAPGTRRAMDLAAGSVSFTAVPMRTLRKSHLETWVKRMATAGQRGKPLAPGTMRTRLQNVRTVLLAAVADKVIPADPSKGVKVARGRKAEAAMVIPTPAEVGKILPAADSPFRAYVALCAFAGLRLGEAAAVQVGDIDFLRRQLTVSRQVQREPGGGVEIRPPKYGSERTVYLAPALVEILSAHVAEHCPGDDVDRWLFTGTDGKLPPHQNTVGHRWRMRLKAGGLEGRYTLHDLRHFFASGLIAAGCDVVTVQRALGHAKATTTLNTYSHLWPTAEDRTRNAAEAMLAEATAIPADSLRTGGGG